MIKRLFGINKSTALWERFLKVFFQNILSDLKSFIQVHPTSDYATIFMASAYGGQITPQKILFCINLLLRRHFRIFISRSFAHVSMIVFRV